MNAEDEGADGVGTRGIGVNTEGLQKTVGLWAVKAYRRLWNRFKGAEMHGNARVWEAGARAEALMSSSKSCSKTQDGQRAMVVQSTAILQLKTMKAVRCVANPHVCSIGWDTILW